MGNNIDQLDADILDLQLAIYKIDQKNISRNTTKHYLEQKLSLLMTERDKQDQSIILELKECKWLYDAEFYIGGENIINNSHQRFYIKIIPKVITTGLSETLTIVYNGMNITYYRDGNITIYLSLTELQKVIDTYNVKVKFSQSLINTFNVYDTIRNMEKK